jgi:hypothetical protein
VYIQNGECVCKIVFYGIFKVECSDNYIEFDWLVK